MKTIGEILKLSGDFLVSKKIERGKRVAEEILAHVLQLKRMDLYLQYDRPMVDAEIAHMREKVRRLALGEPVEYVIGSIDFFGCQIGVDPRVLIPRPETEILVEKVAKIAKRGVLWDLCTGSGCIGIALKKANPELQVTLSDISQEALQVARENAERNGVVVALAHGDLLAPFQGKRADFIVANPPYVAAHEYVKGFEPEKAFLAGASGIEVYVRLQKEMKTYLQPGGSVFFEIGSNQKEKLLSLFPGASIECDYANHPRYLFFNADLLPSFG